MIYVRPNMITNGVITEIVNTKSPLASAATLMASFALAPMLKPLLDGRALRCRRIGTRSHHIRTIGQYETFTVTLYGFGKVAQEGRHSCYRVASPKLLIMPSKLWE
jgi:hypothetical protein